METLHINQQPKNLDDKIFQSKTKLFALAAVVVLVCAVAVAGPLFLKRAPGNFVFHAGFFVAGCLQLLKEENLKLTQRERLFLHVGLALFVSLALGTVHFFVPQINWLMAIAGVSAFLLPFSLQSAQLFYEELSFSNMQPWYFQKTMALQKSTTFLNSQEIRFMVRWPDCNDTVLLSFRAPVRMPLGLLFYHSVQQQKEKGTATIDLGNEAGEAYGWVFYTSGLVYGRRYLNPEASLIENAVGKNVLVTVLQVREPTATPALTNSEAALQA